MMMDRRVFLKLTGLVAAVSALEALPVAAERHPDAAPVERADGLELASVPSGTWLTIREPGTYRISGRVRLDEPLVEISGIADTQWISWSDVEGPERPMAGFTTFEHFDGPGMTPAIRVRGGRLEAVAAVPVDFE
jgi:hypothetical protein